MRPGGRYPSNPSLSARICRLAALTGSVWYHREISGLKAVVMGNAKRLYFITREEAAKVLEACPDAQWRLLFALSRYGGLRCPSEHLGLKWGDVDWERNRILVRSPKTEHHAGGESRMIPLFPELLSHLLEVFSQPNPGEYVISRYRDTNGNLRTQLRADHQEGRIEALAEAVPEPTEYPRNRTGGDLARACCVCLDWQHRSGSPQALSTSNG